MTTPTTPGGHVLVATVRARAGREERVLDRLRELAAVSREEPGCRHYRLHRDPVDPLTFVLHEEWRDLAAWERHDTRAPVVDLLAALAPDLAGPIDVRRLLPA